MVSVQSSRLCNGTMKDISGESELGIFRMLFDWDTGAILLSVCFLVLGVTKVSKYFIDLRELLAHSKVLSFSADPLKDFLHALRLIVPVGLTLLASGLSL